MLPQVARIDRHTGHGVSLDRKHRVLGSTVELLTQHLGCRLERLAHLGKALHDAGNAHSTTPQSSTRSSRVRPWLTPCTSSVTAAALDGQRGVHVSRVDFVRSVRARTVKR